MDLNGPTRFRPRKSAASDRFLSAFPSAPHENPSSSSSTASTADAGVELNEHDVFWTGEYAEADYSSQHQNQSHSTPPSSASSTPRHNPHPHIKSFSQVESFGILAALPENETSPNIRNVSNLYHKASLSSSSSSSTSSSRVIPAIPKPPQERLGLPSSVRYQSAPVNVPILSTVMRRHADFEEVDDDDAGDGEWLPPHEIVARAQSPMLACSVLEGAGRTLKGRDLRQVRNAVWRRTGFLD